MAKALSERYDVAHTVVCTNLGILLATSAIAELDHKDAVQTRLTLGYLGRISTEKGVPVVLEVADQLMQEHDIYLKLAGALESLELEAKIEHAIARSAGRVSYLGEVKGEDKDQFLRDVDLLLLPSSYKNEAEPLVILEAAAAGIPTFAFDRGCISDLIGGSSVLLIDADGDFLREVVTAIKDLLKSEDGLKELRREVKSRFRTLAQDGLRQWKAVESLFDEVQLVKPDQQQDLGPTGPCGPPPEVSEAAAPD